ncbi:helix-turn-helix domain-containing protein [Frankia sp. Cj3]
MELAHRHRHRQAQPGGGVAITLRLPQHDLAVAIGASREPVGRDLKNLRSRGVIKKGAG